MPSSFSPLTRTHALIDRTLQSIKGKKNGGRELNHIRTLAMTTNRSHSGVRGVKRSGMDGGS